MRDLPGFIPANVHRSLDGTKVINHAQWESVEAFTSSLRNPDVAAYFERLAQIGTPDPVLCEVVSVHHVWHGRAGFGAAGYLPWLAPSRSGRDVRLRSRPDPPSSLPG
jgi:Antibiotic biosynthesis monooxygenase